jgi:transcriptional regulator with XRE-family HTH domain
MSFLGAGLTRTQGLRTIFSIFELLIPVSMIVHPEKKLKQLRELKNYTQEYMATELGLSTRAYSKIEAGETQLTINRLNEISRVLGIEPMEILGFDHKNIFNNCTQEGDNSTMGTSTYLAPDKLMEQYEQRIKHLESEIIFLRALVK